MPNRSVTAGPRRTALSAATTRPFRLTFRDGRPLRGYVDFPATANANDAAGFPVVVACHGFKGFAEWGFLPFLGDNLARRGLAVVRFNFSGTGRDLGDELVTDPGAFRSNTVSREIAELTEVIERLREIAALAQSGAEASPIEIDPRRLALFGHSRGGAVALLAAANPFPPAAPPRRPPGLRALVTWGALSRFDRISPREIALWRERGELPFVHERTGQYLPLGLDLLDDLERHRERLDPLGAAERRSVPWLLVHGEADETIPVEEARALAAAARAPRELVTVPGADHGLDGRHPFPGPRPSLIAAVGATESFLTGHLSSPAP